MCASALPTTTDPAEPLPWMAGPKTCVETFLLPPRRRHDIDLPGTCSHGAACRRHVDGADIGTGIRRHQPLINSQPLTMTGLHGKVVLIDFWAYSCINCLRAMPHTEHLYETYRDKGLVVVGVHSPEFDFESDPSIITRAVGKLACLSGSARQQSRNLERVAQPVLASRIPGGPERQADRPPVWRGQLPAHGKRHPRAVGTQSAADQRISRRCRIDEGRVTGNVLRQRAPDPPLGHGYAARRRATLPCRRIWR